MTYQNSNVLLIADNYFSRDVPSQDSFFFIRMPNKSLDLYRIKEMMFGMKQLQLFADIVF